MGRKYFGTDGVRGQVGQFPITPEFVLKLGWAAGKVFAGHGLNRVIIGKDTRLSGYMFESALEAGLSAAGVDAWLLGPMPTPAIAYLTRTFSAKAGVVISASHNPYYDNGIKFFSGQGTKLPDDIELTIEEMIDQEITFADPASLGRARRINDAAGRYIEYCKSTVTHHLDLSGLHIVVDAAHGATYQVGPAVFRELGAKVDAIGVTPDGLNINKECGSTHLDPLKLEVLARKADLGIAFDGDGDRVLMVDHTGREIDGDELLYVIASHRHKCGKLNGGVVGTIMSNLGLEKAFDREGIPFERAKVGDRYVNELLLDKGWQLGGESSGHLICRHVSTTGDGIVAALQVLRIMAETDTRLADLCAGMVKYPQTMINVRMDQRMNPETNKAIAEAIRATETDMSGRGRVLLRTSGTEPVIRVMIEGEDATEVSDRCQALADIVRSELRRL